MNPFLSFHFWRGVAIIIAAAALTWVLEYRGWFDSLEGVAFDFLHSMVTPGSEKEISNRIIIVDIDEDSYTNCFDGVAPLNEERVLELVKEVASRKPSVVGIDLLTESKKYAGLYLNKFNPLRDNQPSKIWAVDSFKSGDESGHERLNKSSFVLGFNVRAPPPELKWAPPIYPQEGDAHVRRYPRNFALSTGASEPLVVKTWARAVAEEYRRPVGSELDHGPEQVFLMHRKNVRWIPARSFLDACKPPKEAGSHSDNPLTRLGEKLTLNDQEISKVLENQIVLIGGSFHHKDEHLGPAGEISGIALNAAAVEAELSGDFLREWPRWKMFILDVLVGVILLFFEIRSPAKTVRDKFIHVAIAAFVLFLISAGMMYFNILWLGWNGLLLGMLVVLIIELNVENPKMNEHHSN